MCDNNVEVARRIEVTEISKEIAELIKTLEGEIHGEEVNIPVQQTKKVASSLEKLILGKSQ
jgi:hypothetical protein